MTSVARQPAQPAWWARRAQPRRRQSPRSAARERVAVHVIAVALPEAGASAERSSSPRSHFADFQKVQVWDHHPHRAAVDRLDLVALVGVRHDRLVRGDVGQGDVGRVPLLGVLHHVGRRRLHPCPLEQVPDPHPRPRGVELRPLRHAVDVERRRQGRHRAQLVEIDRERPIDQAEHGQAPLVRAVLGHVTHVQHGEAIGQVLPRRQAGRVVPRRRPRRDCARRTPSTQSRRSNRVQPP